MDTEDDYQLGASESYSSGGDEDPSPVAENAVRCSGLEERITDCIFQGNRGVGDSPFGSIDDLVPLGEIERPVEGRCDTDRRAMLTVVCRNFPILGTRITPSLFQLCLDTVVDHRHLFHL